MSDNPARKPKHALPDDGLFVPAQGGPRHDVVNGAPVPGGDPRAADVPAPAPAGDDLPAFADSALPGTASPDVAEAHTEALRVIPRPRDDARDDDVVRGYPSPVTVARLPEPFRPAPVRGAAAPSGGFRLPELPAAVRPVLPAVLGAATALILALGVVAGVNGAPDPDPVAPPPVSVP